ncbi:MAG: CoA-binding protein [Candidatus Omnitrophica bacterium]|nr:CoA-binding protein [Candidatus Omnitrophota bacterium]
MQNLIREFFKQKHFAVVGSFRNESKVAYRILKILRSRGYEVFPVNPRLKEVEGLTCYPHIKDIPKTVDVVDIVTPPVITETIVKECKEKSITRVWLQPGAESEEVIKFCNDNRIKAVFNHCIMVEVDKII